MASSTFVLSRLSLKKRDIITSFPDLYEYCTICLAKFDSLSKVYFWGFSSILDKNLIYPVQNETYWKIIQSTKLHALSKLQYNYTCYNIY